MMHVHPLHPKLRNAARWPSRQHRSLAQWSAAVATLIALLAFGVSAELSNDSITDSRIAREIDQDLIVDQIVSAHLIDVQVNDGIVGLSGSVSNLLEKERAATIAKQLKGVQGVVNRIDVRPVLRNDSKLRNDIVYAFTLDPAVEATEIAVDVDTGVVTLTGTVDSWAEKRLATRVTKGIKGVKEIRNNMVVDFQEARSDDEIREEIVRRLELDPRIYSSLVEVKVTDGKVALSGMLGTAVDKSAAHAAAWVNGVEEVNSDGIEVSWMARDELDRNQRILPRTDDQIREAVVLALTHDPRTAAYAIDVEVDDGVVTLSGTVRTLKARRAAGRDARNTVGAMSVENDLDVEVPPLENDAIKRNLERAFFWDPVLERHEIEPIVRNAKAYLYGRVDNTFERLRAGDIASQVSGVAAVENNLSVANTWMRHTDHDIERQIENRMFWSTRVDQSDIRVEVDDGVATLTGEVDDWTEHYAAIDRAFDGGARVVKSELSVDGSQGALQSYGYYEFQYLFPDRVYF